MSTSPPPAREGWQDRASAFLFRGQVSWPMPFDGVPPCMPWPVEWSLAELAPPDQPEPEPGAHAKGLWWPAQTCTECGKNVAAAEGARCIRCGTTLCNTHAGLTPHSHPNELPICRACRPEVARFVGGWMGSVIAGVPT